ncbi:MAG: cation transporter dimerization domain-containing protein [Candidatus Competibacteraceae bacterium]
MQQSRTISSEVVACIHTALPDAAVLVHTQPLVLDNETIADQVRLIAAGHDVAAHHVMVDRIEGRICVSFDLEVDGTLSIKEAHTLASTIEAAIRAELGEAVLIESHLDPRLADLVEEAHPVNPERLAVITEALLQQTRTAPDLIDIHNIQVRAVSSGLHIAFHCCFQDEAGLEQVHDTVTRLEYRLYEPLPEARRIIIHAEPARHRD